MNTRDLEIFLRGLHVGIKLAEESDGSLDEVVTRRARGKGEKSKEEKYRDHSAMMKKAWETRRRKKLEEGMIKEEAANFGPKE